MIPTSKEFQDQLMKILEAAAVQGRPYIDISSGSLHRLVWGYYGRKNRLPQCCYAMRKIMKEEDIILHVAGDCKNDKLIIRYKLPR